VIVVEENGPDRRYSNARPSGTESSLAVASVHKIPDPRLQRRGPRLLHLPTWSHLSIATRQRGPVGHAGGDFFEIIQHRDGHVSTLVADVCGNGPTAAVPVSRLRWLVRQHLARGDAPGALLSMLNDAIIAVDTPDLFVTAICVQIDPVSGSVTVASAGHLGPFIKRASGDAQELVMAAGAALGILPDQPYAEKRIDLEPQDAIVLVTDGITDPLGTASSPLGQAGLLGELSRARPSAESICSALLSGGTVEHDATVVVLKLPVRHRRATPVRAPVR
jgi:phosphoserine phosphatase RsbU/P